MNIASERFAALEAEVEAVLDRQKIDPYIPTAHTTTAIAGFEVVNPDRKSQIVEQIAKRISGYATAKAALLQEVRSLGVEPLAALPATAWHNICRISKLHRPTVTGSTARVDVDSFSKLIKKTSDRVFAYLGRFFIIGSPVIAFPIMWNNLRVDWETPDKFLACAAVSVVVFAGVVALIGTQNKRIMAMIYRTVARYYLQFKWDKILTMILAQEHAGFYTIRLPKPPEDVQDILLKSARLNPRVAAVADAIRFPDLVQGAIDLIPEPLPVDPIIYIEKNGVVVIVAQFGNFPIERDVVKRLSDDEILR